MCTSNESEKLLNDVQALSKLYQSIIHMLREERKKLRWAVAVLISSNIVTLTVLLLEVFK